MLSDARLLLSAAAGIDEAVADGKDWTGCMAIISRSMRESEDALSSSQKSTEAMMDEMKALAEKAADFEQDKSMLPVL